MHFGSFPLLWRWLKYYLQRFYLIGFHILQVFCIYEQQSKYFSKILYPCSSLHIFSKQLEFCYLFRLKPFILTAPFLYPLKISENRKGREREISYCNKSREPFKKLLVMKLLTLLTLIKYTEKKLTIVTLKWHF